MVPLVSLQNQFAETVRPIWKLNHQLSQSNIKLILSKEKLLPLISGKLSVENLDIQFPPSMREKIVPQTLAQIA